MPDLVTIRRRTGIDLEFVGDVLAEVTTEQPDKDRWEMWRIWSIIPDKQDSQVKWVVQHIARFRGDGGSEENSEATLCRHPVNVRKALQRRDLAGPDPDRWYMTNSAFAVAEAAAEVHSESRLYQRQ